MGISDKYIVFSPRPLTSEDRCNSINYSGLFVGSRKYSRKNHYLLSLWWKLAIILEPMRHWICKEVL